MKEAIIKFIKKYPVTFVAAIILAILYVKIFNDLGYIYPTSQSANALIESATIVLNIITGSFLSYKIISIYNDKIPEKIRNNKIALSIIFILVILILHFITKCLFKAYLNDDSSPAAFVLSSLFMSLTYFMIIKERNITLHEYVTKVFFNGLALFLFSCIVAVGIGVLFYIYYALFKEVEWSTVANVYIFIFVIIAVIGGYIAIDNVETKTNLFSKILIKYVMMIMVLIGFVFFYIYLIRMIVSRSIPSNQVFAVCTVLFSVGLSTSLMAKSFNENTIYDKIIHYLPAAFVPALVLQMISIALRINQYGLTMSRYMGIIFLLFEASYLIIYFFKYTKLHYTLIVETIIFLITFFIPFVNMYQFPNFYNKHFKKEVIAENNVTNEKEAIGKRTVHYDKYENIWEMNIEGYKKMQDADIHIEYNKEESTWQNFNQTSKKINDFTDVNVIDNESNVIATIDISDHLELIKQSIINNNYSDDRDVVFKDIPNEIINDDKKFIISNTDIKYSEELGAFTEIVFWGYLLTK